MPRIKKIVIDYDKKTVQMDFFKDSNIPSGTHYTPFHHFPLVAGKPHFLDFKNRQKETEDWKKLKHQMDSIKKDLELSVKLCNTLQFDYKVTSIDSFQVTYAFDFGKTLEQR